jgi:inosine-uridine nucleoside N-ribohydrolase
MVPLDLTNSAVLTEDIVQRILSSNPSKFRRMWIEFVQCYALSSSNPKGPFTSQPLHDICAVHIASLIGRGFRGEENGSWQGRKMHCHVNTTHGNSRGRSVCTRQKPGKSDGEVVVALKIDVSPFHFKY